MTRAGFALLALILSMALVAPALAPNRPERRFEDLLNAPPTRVHIFHGDMARPHIHPLKLVSRREYRFEEDLSRAVPLRPLDGALVTADSAGGAPLLVLGADRLGRDIFSRLLYGARTTLALALLSTMGAVAIGAFIGGLAGYAGGLLDNLLSRTSEFLLVLPTIYVVLTLRGVMPDVLSAEQVFALLAGIFTLLGWPVVARGVRAIIRSERERDYAVAARALGLGPARIVVRHLLPCAAGYIAVQSTLLLPAFILAEATMSYVGLGFPDTTPTWGTMLRDAAQRVAAGDAPWTLAPAAAIFVVVLAVNLAVQGKGRTPVQLER